VADVFEQLATTVADSTQASIAQLMTQQQEVGIVDSMHCTLIWHLAVLKPGIHFVVLPGSAIVRQRPSHNGLSCTTDRHCLTARWALGAWIDKTQLTAMSSL